MVTKIIGIHGTSSEITFECEDVIIKATGEFLAKDGVISGFVVSTASLRYGNEQWLSADDKEELIRLYHEYVNQPHIQKDWILEFE